jgi:L-ascorbate metabolism protein UlaG (beta-lactamase superfamily)
MRYKNSQIEYKTHIKQIIPLIYDMIKNKSKDSKPKFKNQIPVNYLRKEDLISLENNSVIRFGHSTLLFKLENQFILTDPVFSNRASPFCFIGPKRFHDNPINIKDLPNIKAVIISHNHYDHLDKKSVKLLNHKVETFYTTLGVSKHLIKFGISKNKIVELNWWENIKVDNLEFVCTPAQHFSGRTLLDRDKTLWSSWVIKSSSSTLFFGADSGYFNGFKEIGQKYGPFDMTFLEAGAYNKKWKEIHMMPHQSIQAHIDLQGKVLFPIHNGTFDLSFHAWYEPFEKIDLLAKEKNIDIRYPIMGKAIPILESIATTRWWESKN